MKKIIYILLVLSLLCGCGAESGNTTHPQVTVNMPTDNTVNGYRTESAVTSSSKEMPDTISAENVRPASPQENPINTSTGYIGNSNSHIFHKSDCDSALKMKSENKILFKKREDAINNGYKPCKRCAP